MIWVEAAAAGPARAASPCPAGHPFARSSQAVIYPAGENVMSCWRPTRFRQTLVESFGFDNLLESRIAITGAYAAFVILDAPGASAGIFELEVFDVRRGGLRSSNATDGRPPPSEGCFGSLGCGVDQTTAITLRRDGAVAFIACCPDGDDNSRVFAVDSSFGVFGGVGRVERRADRGMSDGA